MPLKNTMHFTRVNVEAKAKAITKSFIVESYCELLPPSTEVEINGLYVLLLETYIVMDKKILEKPEETMALLMKMDIKPTLGNMLVFAFG
jgi:hypothetical protein